MEINTNKKNNTAKVDKPNESDAIADVTEDKVAEVDNTSPLANNNKTNGGVTPQSIFGVKSSGVKKIELPDDYIVKVYATANCSMIITNLTGGKQSMQWHIGDKYSTTEQCHEIPVREFEVIAPQLNSMFERGILFVDDNNIVQQYPSLKNNIENLQIVFDCANWLKLDISKEKNVNTIIKNLNKVKRTLLGRFMDEIKTQRELDSNFCTNTNLLDIMSRHLNIPASILAPPAINIDNTDK